MMGKTHIVNAQAVMNTALAYHLTTDIPKYTSGMSTHLIVGAEKIRNIDKFEYIIALAGVAIITNLMIGKRPDKKKHILGFLGILFLLAATNKMTAFLLIVSATMYTIGAILPDIDSEKSILGRYIPGISKSIPHRTVTHTIWAVMFILFVSNMYSSFYILSLVAGYTVHIIQDSFSRQGIAWTYPIKKYKNYTSGAVIKEGRYKPKVFYRTGGATEDKIYIASLTINAMAIIAVLIS